LDTGMHRLGFTAADMPWLLEQLRDKRMPHVASILSHLAASEDPAQDDFTRGQIAAFSSMATRIGEVLGYRPLWHIANSGAVSRFPEARLDMVRLGIGLHGVGVDERETRQLMPVATLRTVIAQLRTVAPGESVSYGRRFIAQRETRIATLPIGYADGLARRLGNAVGKVWINDKAAPFVGTICMDMCMVDVTDIPVDIDDEVIVFGPEHPVQKYARDLGTIPYEALTSISPRVRRVYVQG
ncbi:MAG TPA: alanine racemase, partial [Flavobacteriales bacterium]|nr:alanine racemase [Flavobacteriales bacterium]